MEPNAQNQPIIPDPNVPKIPTLMEEKPSSSKKILLSLGLAAVILIAGVGYFYYSKAPKTYNATVYNQPTTASVSPSPTVYQTNPKDTSDQGLNNDSKALDQSMTTINSDINSVDQSFSDQQTNLQ